ncbi:hypothetical protein EDB85DRAFT_2293776 [Lactarius pseudohatsudake]|nr:hypothetical protein EDB85DRAFT_2293776 [Lactarius pseudohatsudake]
MTVTNRKRPHPAEEVSTINEPGVQTECDGCLADLTHSIRIKCANPACVVGEGVDLCPNCFCSGKEFGKHKRGHAYRVEELHSYPIFSEDWGADEELLLIEGTAQQGLGNWQAVAEYVGTRTREEVEEHYNTIYIDSPNWPRPRMDQSFDIDPTDPKTAPTSAPGVHEVATFLPGRLEFEHEVDNEAEDLIKNLEFGLCMEWGGDSITEDEDDHDYKTRLRWKEEQKEKEHEQEQGFTGQNGLVNGLIHSNGNGVAMNGVNGAANGYIKKEKEVKKEKDTPAPDDTDGAEEESEENMPPIPFETQASLEFKLTLIEMYMQRMAKRREAKTLMFDRGLLEYKKLQAAEKKRPKDDKDIVHRLRPFARLQAAEDYEVFCTDILYEAMLRKRIAELQQFRKLGLTTAADIKKWEEDLYKRVRSTQAKANMSRDSRDSSSFGLQVHDSLLDPTIRGATVASASMPIGRALTKQAPPDRQAADPSSLHLLTPAEQTLCSTLRILPKPYLVIKETLVREYARRGGKLRRREARDLVKIDVNKTSRVWDFLVQAGYLRIGVDQSQQQQAQSQSQPQQQPTPQQPPAPSISGGNLIWMIQYSLALSLIHISAHLLTH